MRHNLITSTDSYKQSHSKIYPPQTTGIYSYFESRAGAKFHETTFFGLQYILKEYLVGQVVTQEKIDQAEKLINLHMPSPADDKAVLGSGRSVGTNTFNRAGWQHILDKHQGFLPVRIKAVPEG